VTKRKTPADLGPVGTRFWREVTRKYQLRVDEGRVLLDAAAEADLIDTLASALKGAPLTVAGSQGQEVINPLISELRLHRVTLASLLKQLNLPDAAGNTDPRAIPGGKPRSTAARLAANTRWRPSDC